MIAENIYYLSNIRQALSKHINILLTHNQINEKLLIDLKDLSKNNLGQCKLIIHLKSENGNIQKILSGNITVNSNIEFIQNLRNYCGNKNVWIN